MKNKLIKIACFTFVAATLMASPAICRADDSTNAPAAPATPKPHGLPFHGKVSAVDTTAMTFTVGETTLTVNSKTKIKKDGEPATMSDITVGETVRGSYKKDDAGVATATSVMIGQKKKAAPQQ
jgi:hypothetical protein